MHTHTSPFHRGPPHLAGGGGELRLRTLVSYLVKGSLALYVVYSLWSTMHWKEEGQKGAVLTSTTTTGGAAHSHSLARETAAAGAAAGITTNKLTSTHKKTLQSLLDGLKRELILYQDEIPESFLKTTVTTPFHGEAQDRHKVVDVKCPRYVTMMKPMHGLGHQMGTFTTTMITAIFFNLTYVDSPYTDEGYHGKYPGIADFTGLGEGEIHLADIETEVDKVIEVTEMPIEPFSDDIKVLYEPLREAFQGKYKDECNVLFKLREYYSYDYGSFTKAIVARKFKQAPHREPIDLLYNPKEFIVAIHIRVGDITPTSEEYFLTILRQMLPTLEAKIDDKMDNTHIHKFPYRVHVFAELKGEEDFPGIVSLVGKDKVMFHPDMPPFDSFYHLTQAHVFIMSASGFSQFPAIAGTKALVFSPPSREIFPLKFCPPYAVCCLKDGRYEMEGTLRLMWRKERWWKLQRVKEEVAGLERLLEDLE